MPRSSRNAVLALALLAPAFACGSGAGGSDAGAPELEPSVLPDAISISDPADPIRDIELVEDLTEEVADRLLDLGVELQRRDFVKAREWFAPDFAGTVVDPLVSTREAALHLGANLTAFDVGSGAIAGRLGFLESFERLLGPYARVELALWKVKGAEFERDGRSGKIHLYLHVIADTDAGGREDLAGWAWAAVEKRKGNWFLVRFALESLERTRLERRAFRDISAAAGVGYLGIRYGKPGNTSDAWNGAAAGDVDGDGLFDIFVPSGGRNLLYRARADGRFDEEAEARGVAGPGGGTGTVFFDFDNDGDQDLFVAHRAWRVGDKWKGETLHLYANDGQGHFTDVTAAVGLDVHRYGMSVTAFDYDLDGFVDLFVTGYGRAATEHNDAWLEATNGAPNSLFRNLGGERFEDVAGELGMAGTKWTYASAAADYDADGDLDLYVVNDYGSNELWRNEGDGTFKEVAEQLGVVDQGQGMGAAWGDLDGDGRLDLYVANMSSTAGNRILERLRESLPAGDFERLKKFAAGNSIFLASPEGGFRRQERAAGGVGANWAWSVALNDFDLDACLDVFCVNGFVTGDLAHDT